MNESPKLAVFVFIQVVAAHLYGSAEVRCRLRPPLQHPQVLSQRFAGTATTEKRGVTVECLLCSKQFDAPN
jgi:hypothetical protein